MVGMARGSVNSDTSQEDTAELEKWMERNTEPPPPRGGLPSGINPHDTPEEAARRFAEAATVRLLSKNLHFLLKNLHILLKNVHFLLKNVDFLLKKVDFIIKQGRPITPPLRPPEPEPEPEQSPARQFAKAIYFRVEQRTRLDAGFELPALGTAPLGWLEKGAVVEVLKTKWVGEDTQRVRSADESAPLGWATAVDGTTKFLRRDRSATGPSAAPARTGPAPPITPRDSGSGAQAAVAAIAGAGGGGGLDESVEVPAGR